MKFENEHNHRAFASTLFPFATIDFPCTIGADTKIWQHAYVSSGAIIGNNCMLGQGVHVGPGVRIGDGCKIQNGAQLFEGVTLEDEVFIGPHVVFTNVLTPRAFVGRKKEFKPTLVKRGASVGANATILCGSTVNEYALIGAGSVVRGDVQAFTCVVGIPAARTKRWACVCGTLMEQMTIQYGACHECRRRYTFDGSAIHLVPFDDKPR